MPRSANINDDGDQGKRCFFRKALEKNDTQARQISYIKVPRESAEKITTAWNKKRIKEMDFY